MFLVELVMQGIRGFQQLARLRFQGGFNLVAAGNEAGKTTAVDSIVRLLFPVNDPARMAPLVSRATPDASRGALVVFSDDQTYYQVIQDFSKRAVNLSKHDPATKKFALQHKDWNATAQFMGGMLPNLSEEDYGRLFVFRRESCAGGGGAAPAAAGAPSSVRPHAAPAAGRTAAQEAKLKELRETMHKAEEAADAEYKADAARIRLGEVAKKLERIEESRSRFAELGGQIDELKVCATFPENLADMIGDHESAQSQKMVKTSELDNDIEGLTMQRNGMPQANLLTEKLFIAGVALGGIALVLGLFILEGDQAVFFPLGVLGALLLVAAGWYNGSRKNAQRKAVQKEIDALVKERAEVEKKFQDSGATILKFMKAAGVTSAGALKEKADTYRHLQSLLQDLEEQQRMALGGQAVEDLLAEQARQQTEVAELEQASRALAKHAVDTYSIRQEIERIEGESASSAPDLAFAEPSFVSDLPHAGSAHGGPNIMAEMAVASRVSGIEMETLVPAVESAAQRNLAAVSAGKYVRVEVGPDGLPAVQDKNGERHAYAGLSHSTREAVCFCLRAGLVEAIAGKRRLPFLLDDPFASLDQTRQQAACQVLRLLGTKTQVILFTSNPALRAPNDVAAELK